MQSKITIPNKLVFEHVLEYLQQDKYVTIRVKGNSMNPFLREGDQVVLKPFKRKDLTKGVIALAKVGDQMVLHRVVKYNDERIWLAGDGNLAQHELVNYFDVVATAVSLYREDVEVKINRRWRCILGQIWYWARPLRRVVMKLY